MSDENREPNRYPKFNVHIPDRRKSRPPEDQKVVKFRRKDEDATAPPASEHAPKKSDN